ncbi:flagellar protein FlaG [Piscirickettsia salmonis]|uniref:flagellar protein FlaG n=1 Tax=Piscirickettsia salmonis TaxID=1238 RepID=UPI001E353908|nr:flagellar protein FlaG [Piscirickettsia salmonis]QGP55142.1 flagellar protein FlaG [Piscirickettsia salmonis]QGP58999.1 flagellar protein FlaG [Piscirickettsia salmonis]QGP64707.1 flagellar protein FlaG [Piscirickettsia salmonis]
MKIEHTSISTQNTQQTAATPAKIKVNEVERLARLNQEIKEQEHVLKELEQAEPVTEVQSRARIEQAIAGINQFIQPIHGQKVSFELRDDVDEAVAFVQDKETGEVIRQVPSEEVLKIHAQIKALREQGDESALSLLANFRA